MSRSYRKTPIVKEHRSNKYGKQQANRKVRRYNKVPHNQHLTNKGYKKLFETWDISDFTLKYTKEEALRDIENGESQYQSIADWKKDYYFK